MSINGIESNRGEAQPFEERLAVFWKNATQEQRREITALFDGGIG